MIFVGLCGVFGILTFAMQRIFSVGGCQQSALAVHDGNANAQCPKIYSGNGRHARSPVMSFAPARLSSREFSHLAFRRELDAIDQPQDEQQGSPPYRSMQIGQVHRLGRIRPFRQPAGKNQESIHQQEYSHKEPNRNDVMFFAHLASPENNLKDQQDRQGGNSPKKRPVQETRVLFPRHFRQAVDKSFQLFVGLGLRHQGH